MFSRLAKQFDGVNEKQMDVLFRDAYCTRLTPDPGIAEYPGREINLVTGSGTFFMRRDVMLPPRRPAEAAAGGSANCRYGRKTVSATG